MSAVTWGLAAGLSGVVALCRTLERLGKAGDMAAARPHVTALIEGWPKVVERLDQERRKHAPNGE